MNKYDVVVVGGGISGTMAAIAAAREGAKTLLVEKHAALGGMATLGLVQPITTWGLNDRFAIGGTGKKILENLHSRNKRAATEVNCYGPTCDTEYLKYELENLAIDSGVNLLYHTYINDVKMQCDDSIDYLRAFSKKGEFLIHGSTYIDATGDGDIAAFSGIPFNTGKEEGGQMGITLMMIISGIDVSRCPAREEMAKIWEEYKVSPRQVCFFWHPREGSAYFNMSEVAGMDGLDPVDLTTAVVECRKQCWDIFEVFKRYIPGFENSYIEQTAPAIGVRETRRIIGQHVLSREDIDNSRHFEDVIARASCPVDIHLRKGDKGEYYTLKKSYGIPYRSLITEKVSNLIVTGRSISTDQAAQSSVRRMAPGFALGEAAGIAAVLSKENGDVRSINIKKLQDMLKGYGAILDQK
jgi:hypothetical protein